MDINSSKIWAMFCIILIFVLIIPSFESLGPSIILRSTYDKRDDFDFEIETFPFLNGDFPRSPSYGVYISQLIRFARVCSNVDDFNNRNLILTAKLSKQDYRHHKIRKSFSKFYRRRSGLIVKYNIGLKTLLQQGMSLPIYNGDYVLFYFFRRNINYLLPRLLNFWIYYLKLSSVMMYMPICLNIPI